VLRPETKLKLSIRLPPSKDPQEAEKAFIKLVIFYFKASRQMTENVPYGATVEIS
jgi:hypothetical protein